MTANPRGFASDNFSGAHPDVLAAVAAVNEGHVPAYGWDHYTAAALERLREQFGEEATPALVLNGTGANLLAMRVATRPHQAVICAETAHVNVDEAGASEAIAGVKLLTTPTPDGKLTPELAGRLAARIGEQHAAQPRVVSISQASELGTVYRPEEVRALADLAHERGMLLHVDGARLANAAAFLDASLSEITTDAGADLVSFGATKNGALLADALIVLRPELAEDLKYLHQQSAQVASKMRFLAAQIDALLSDELWLRNARHANEMAGRLAEALEGVDGVEITQPVESNAVFATLPRESIDRLREQLPGELPFYVWDESRGEVRLMCSWDTTSDDVDALAAALTEVAAATRA